MFDNEALYSFDWTQTSTLSYGDFLRAKQFERSMRFAVEDQTRQIVATNQELAERGFEILSDISDNLETGFTMVSQDIQDLTAAVNEGFDAVVSTLNWGFSEVLVSLGKMNDSLVELVKIARTPSQTWAYEQFDIARDEFRRGLYPEALESVERAIDGYGSNAGYKTEFRFHFLLGSIRLGSWQNTSDSIVDPKAAEDAFLLAERYALSDHPEEAGRALICAGRAADVQGQITKTIAYTRKGLSLASHRSEGHYQLARALAQNGDALEAECSLVRSILLDVNQGVVAASEPVFLERVDFLSNALATARGKYRDQLQLALGMLNDLISEVSSFSHSDVRADIILEPEIRNLSEALSTAKHGECGATIFGLDTYIREIKGKIENVPTLFSAFRVRAVNSLESRLSRMTVTVPKECPSLAVFLLGGACLAGVYWLLFVFGPAFAGNPFLAFINLFSGVMETPFGPLFMGGLLAAVAWAPLKLKHLSDSSDRENSILQKVALRGSLTELHATKCPTRWSRELPQFSLT